MFFVTAMYERSMSLSLEPIALTQKSKPTLPLMGDLLSMITVLLLNFCQIL